MRLSNSRTTTSASSAAAMRGATSSSPTRSHSSKNVFSAASSRLSGRLLHSRKSSHCEERGTVSAGGARGETREPAHLVSRRLRLLLALQRLPRVPQLGLELLRLLVQSLKLFFAQAGQEFLSLPLLFLPPLPLLLLPLRLLCRAKGHRE